VSTELSRQPDSRLPDRVRVAVDADRPVLDAWVLPLLFLTVALLGGVRVGEATIRFEPPPLMALVLALLLIGVLVQGGVLWPERLMHPTRDGMANLAGAIVLVALGAAGAQVFNSLTPPVGLPNLLFNLFFLVLLWNTLASAPDAVHLLRSLVVVLGSAFAMKYIVLDAVYDPAGGLLKRVLTTLLEGASLGTFEYRPDAPATGYLALFTVLLFLVGVFLLPRRR
jgi:hypothetical protein